MITIEKKHKKFSYGVRKLYDNFNNIFSLTG